MSMASRFKEQVVKTLHKSVYNKYYFGKIDQFYGDAHFNINPEKSKISLNYRWKNTEKSDSNFRTYMENAQNLFPKEIIAGVQCKESDNKFLIDVDLHYNNLVKDVLHSNPVSLLFKSVSKKVIVEYSSPNIAKPFHMGHLRSTVIGNFLANLKNKLGNDVIKLNYLGDWGTQLGLLQIGVELQNLNTEELKKDPIMLLYKAYVVGNREAELKKEIYEKAKKIFQDLENENEQMLNIWNQYKIWTLEELKKTYSRLGVEFDEYSWESDYRRKYADKILETMEKKGILSTDDKGRRVAVLDDKVMPLLKGDNTTLYLLRDLMAVDDRRLRHKFDEMYYVVESGQGGHFQSLFNLCEKLEISKEVELKQVKFGKIHGLSTRKGKVVFLKDILDEAKERAYERQVKSKTTKTSLESKDVAEIIGVSAVVVNDLKRRRQLDYEMSWENVLQIVGPTGSMLQYCHCRLCSLEANCGVKPASDCDPAALLEPEAVNLVLVIANYENCLLQSNRKLESSTLLNYMFKLAKTINVAFKTLNIQKSDPHVGSQRLLLFLKAKEVLADGLKILGLKPLTAM